MQKLPRLFLTLSVISALIGFSGLGGPIVNGLGKALGAILFILFFIAQTVGQAEDEPATVESSAKSETLANSRAEPDHEEAIHRFAARSPNARRH